MKKAAELILLLFEVSINNAAVIGIGRKIEITMIFLKSTKRSLPSL